MTAWTSRSDDGYDKHAITRGNHAARTQLDRLVSPLARLYPDVEVRSVAVHGRLLDHLAENSDVMQMVVVGAAPDDVTALVGSAGNAVLQRTDCSVLIVRRQHL